MENKIIIIDRITYNMAVTESEGNIVSVCGWCTVCNRLKHTYIIGWG